MYMHSETKHEFTFKFDEVKYIAFASFFSSL